jgi:hypothetical protein
LTLRPNPLREPARASGTHGGYPNVAPRLTDAQTLEQVAAGYRAGGWPAQVDGDAFTAPFNTPSAGPPPWHVYRYTFHTVVGVATREPYGATRWRFQR